MSGKDYQRHAALSNVMKNKEYGIRRAIVLSNDNLSESAHVLYAPIYMTMFLHHQAPQGPMVYKPELP